MSNSAHIVKKRNAIEVRQMVNENENRSKGCLHEVTQGMFGNKIIKEER